MFIFFLTKRSGWGWVLLLYGDLSIQRFVSSYDCFQALGRFPRPWLCVGGFCGAVLGFGRHSAYCWARADIAWWKQIFGRYGVALW
ncbi:hypothetical protein BU25DRAFT_117766 [Macroventuria anomochaeta]|uniref:Uncharacterized protein n=1 Tax=Macroventuria anomochaeta TaxID=301207 RepID=A0ACB6RU12_9PLEO|nr:uncharacterized protein BU25DRAFT_117766 [Macroventuria anomochaeta]KAF2625264.1 hypothetical protein BU25DRAFT_117766 [Macroventuria anomochaeta]